MNIFHSLFKVYFLFCLSLLVSCSNLENSEAILFIDNYCGQDVLITLDGEKWLRIDNDSSVKRSLPPGDYRFLQLAQMDNRVLDSVSTQLEMNKKYVMNILGGALYSVHQTVVLPKGEIDIDETLGGSKHMQDKFFEATQDYVFEAPENFTGISKQKSRRTTFIRRISAEEKQLYEITENDYWRRIKNGLPMEALSDEAKDQVYDIIREDLVCESLDQLAAILTNDHAELKSRCAEVGSTRGSESLENWTIAKNRLIQLILLTIPSGKQNVKQYTIL